MAICRRRRRLKVADEYRQRTQNMSEWAANTLAELRANGPEGDAPCQRDGPTPQDALRMAGARAGYLEHCAGYEQQRK